VPIASFSITLNDDPFLGISLTIFCAGCNRRCYKCQQPELQDPSYGIEMSLDEIKEKIRDRLPLIDSVVFCGGEFNLYPDQLLDLATFCKNNNLRTILYTGFKYESLREDIKKVLDVVIDGEFDFSKRTSSFPSSSNQRVFVSRQLVDPSTLPINKQTSPQSSSNAMYQVTS
jgi:anaerobic ribonucleoside-triphosphate reductase activating protein